MISFNELKIDQEGTNFTIDVQVKDLPYFQNVYIDKVNIDSQDTFVITGVSTSPVYSHEELPESTTKSLQLVLTQEDLGIPISGNMFFVYVTVKGSPEEDTPDEMNIPVTLGVAVYLYPFYTKTIGYLSEISSNCGDTCVVSKTFIDYILKLKALELALNTGHYTQAIQYWNKFFKDIPVA